EGVEPFLFASLEKARKTPEKKEIIKSLEGAVAQHVLEDDEVWHKPVPSRTPPTPHQEHRVQAVVQVVNMDGISPELRRDIDRFIANGPDCSPLDASNPEHHIAIGGFHLE